MIVIDKVYKVKDSYEEIFLFKDKSKKPKTELISMKNKIIGDKHRDNLFLFEPKGLYIIKTKYNYTESVTEHLSELGFIVTLLNEDGYLFFKVFNPSYNTIYISSDATIADRGD